MARGGKRPGAGRKKGSGTTKTRKTNALAAKAAGEGTLPLEVMLVAMRAHFAAGRLDRAAAVAKDAAPYVHPRLSAVQPVPNPTPNRQPYDDDHSDDTVIEPGRAPERSA